MKIAYSSEELITQYQNTSSGHFFDKDTMKFFNSRITGNYRRLSDTAALFITTERYRTDPRKATVRLATLIKYNRPSDGRECYKISIETVGEFNKMTLAHAQRFMKELTDIWSDKK